MLAAVIVPLASCSDGGPRGKYVSKDANLSFTYDFKSSHKVEITTSALGMETTQEMDYTFEDGKIKMGPPGGPRLVLTMDENGCINGGMLVDKLCKEGTAPAARETSKGARTASAAAAVDHPTPASADPAPEASTEVAAMKGDLRNLVTAEEAYFANQVSYTTAAGALSFRASPGVTVTIESATGTGWSATAKHNATAATCGIYVGSATSPIPGANEGEPRCQGMPGSDREQAFGAMREPAFLAAMKSDLRNLVTAEESYFADNVSYTTSATAVHFVSSTGVTVTIGAASGTGWNATAKSASTSKTCGIYVGSGRAPIPGSNEGEPRCQ